MEEAGRRHADGYAFTFGAMGSPTRNFYNDAFARQGYGDDVAEVQRLWLAGDREAAARRVPIEIGLGTNLIGTDDLVVERLRRYRDAGVNQLRVSVVGDTNTARLDDLARPDRPRPSGQRRSRLITYCCGGAAGKLSTSAWAVRAARWALPSTV